MAKPRRGRQTSNGVENRMVRTLDEVSKFEEFRAEILPKLRALMKKGATSEELRKFAQSYLTARQITEALTNPDAAVALRAIDSLTHQNEGRPKERQEVQHRFGSLKDEELDSLLESRLKEVAASDDDSDSPAH